MNASRRRFLGLLGATAATGLAGCAAEPDGDGPETTATDTTTPGAGTAGGGTEDESAEVATVVGERVDGDQLAMVVRSVHETADLGQFQEPDDGNVYVVVELAVKNTTQGEFLDFNGFLQTRVSDDEDYTYDQALAFTGRQLDAGELAPGEVARGDVVYEVPADATGLTLQFDFEAFAFLDLERVTVDLTRSAGSVATLEQDLRVQVHGVGDTVAGEGVQVTLNGAETRGAIGSVEPDVGEEFVVVDVSVSNDSGESQSVSTLLQMGLKDGRGYAYRSDIGGSSQLDRPYSEGSPIADGETRRGQLAYAVETGVAPLYWTFDFALFTNGDKTFWQVR